MAYDAKLAGRVREALGARGGLVEKKMFGGIAFMLHGNMCCGVLEENLIVRLGPEGGLEALKEPHTKPVDFTGKIMRSMVVVAPAALKSETRLKKWVGRGAEFALSLPPK